MREVVVLGVGMMKWGELWGKSLRDLAAEASLAALHDAGVDRVDAMYVGTMSSGLLVEQEHLGSLMPDYLGMNPVPCTRVESACASGGVAFRAGFLDVASGASDLVLVTGVEKMTDVDGDGATRALATASDQEYEAFHGATFPALYALIAKRYMHKYGMTREQLAEVAVKNHRNGALNARAQYPTEVTVEDVVNSVMVADPLRILDCSPITDGAAAVILASRDVAKKRSRKPLIKVAGSGHASGAIALHDRDDITWFPAVAAAAEKAYKMAGCAPEDIHLAEVHDCFTIAEVCVIEALGFCERGKGGTAVRRKVTTLGGKVPVNTSGGLKSKGHPVGATGVAQIIEVVEQLRGESGKRQVDGATRGLTQNMGGTGGSSVVHILEVEK